MSVDEAMQRLANLATEIERHQTGIWLAERERDEVRTELRRALNSSPASAAPFHAEPSASADIVKPGPRSSPGFYQPIHTGDP
jgi:hypothetical protein